MSPQTDRPQDKKPASFTPMRRSHWRGIDLNDEAGRWLMENDPAYWDGHIARAQTVASSS